MSSKRRGLIGVFDSGVGGLSVWREIVAHLPGMDTLYLGDQIHCPYGDRSQREVRGLAEGIVRFLEGQGAEVIVVACNTASSAALHHLRKRFDLPIVGMEPAVKPGVERTLRGRVGVMATPATFRGEPFARLLSRHARNVHVVKSVCPGLVERVEAGELEGASVEDLVRDCLQPILDAGVDVLVLGCTHYPMLRPVIERVVGRGIEVIDPAQAVASQVGRVVAGLGMLRPSEGAGAQHVFYTSGELETYSRLVHQLVGQSGDIRRLEWQIDQSKDHWFLDNPDL